METKTSHELARELLALPDLPVFVHSPWSDVMVTPDAEVRHHGWSKANGWFTGEAVVLK